MATSASTVRALILGYVEDKNIGENLDQALKSDQISRRFERRQQLIGRRRRLALSAGRF
jgi:hypothetical protein